MGGKPGRRKAVVVLDPAQAALLDALALISFRVPRTRLVKVALDAWLPQALEGLRRLYPGEVREIERLVAEFQKAHIPPPPEGVIDLQARRQARQQARRQSRF